MMNTWNTWKLCSKASNSMDSELKEPNAGSSKTQWSTWAVWSAIKEGIQTSKRKIEAILKVRPPTNQTELKSFLGMVNHYGKFIRCLADLSSPLNNLLKKDVQWYWSEECQESFLKIKETLTSTEVLARCFS